MRSIASQVGLTKKHKTPCLIMDIGEVRRRFESITGLLGRPVEVFYSAKANPHRKILKTVADLDGGFDVASWGEIKAVLSLGIPASRIVFSNPIKAPSDIAAATAAGVRLFAFDSEPEIEKLSRFAPGSDVYVRLAVSNAGSLWPLTRKFGVGVEEAIRLVFLARHARLNPIGATFHVGSQCLNPRNWYDAIENVSLLFDACAMNGLQLTLVNLGGGVPALNNAHGVPSLLNIRSAINKGLDRLFAGQPRLIIEPGRYIVATAGTLCVTVIGIAQRRDETWLYIDAGTYGGLMEPHEGFPYEVVTDHPDRQTQRYVIAGPSCDSVDTVFSDIELPEVEIGDRLYFLNAGAYTTSYERYNGFPFPNVYFHFHSK